ncbi:MAG: C40 family peptidase [Eubacteriales bacterium]|nr:C40 family peptidase [Eubacteriales bacterium]
MKKSFFLSALMLSMAFPASVYADGITVLTAPTGDTYISSEPAVLSDTLPVSVSDVISGQTIPTPYAADNTDTFTMFVGPGDGLPAADGSTGAGSLGGPSADGSYTGEGIALDGLYVKPSYWRGDIYCAESCIQNPSTGEWVYTYTDAYNPEHDYLYKVKYEDGDWYVCENFGNDLWLKKAHSTPVTSVPVNAGSEARTKVLQTAFSLLGKPYSYGASGPDSFDCSGFVNYCYKAAGISVPRTSGDFGAMANISYDQLKPGDVLWRSGHVGIYIGVVDGTPKYIHAQNTGTGVVTGTLDAGEYVGFVNVIGD